MARLTELYHQQLRHSRARPTNVQKGQRPTLLTKASPKSLTHVLFKFMQLSFLCLCIYILGVDMKP
jgi:hypothetical protein